MKIVYLISLKDQEKSLKKKTFKLKRSEKFPLPLEDGQNTTSLK